MITKFGCAARVSVFVGRFLRLRRNMHRREYASFDRLLSRPGLGCLDVAPPLEDCLTGLLYPNEMSITLCSFFCFVMSMIPTLAKPEVGTKFSLECPARNRYLDFKDAGFIDKIEAECTVNG